MLLLHFAMVSGLTMAAVAVSTIPESTPTLNPRETTASQSASTTSAIEFITTQYITIAGQTNDHVTLNPQTIALALPTCIQTITPDKNGYVPPGTCGALYDYYPSFAAAVAFAVLFGMLTVAHIAQAAIFKKVSLSTAQPCPRNLRDESSLRLTFSGHRNFVGSSSWDVSGKLHPSLREQYQHDTSRTVLLSSSQASSFC